MGESEFSAEEIDLFVGILRLIGTSRNICVSVQPSLHARLAFPFASSGESMNHNAIQASLSRQICPIFHLGRLQARDGIWRFCAYGMSHSSVLLIVLRLLLKALDLGTSVGERTGCCCLMLLCIEKPWFLHTLRKCNDWASSHVTGSLPLRFVTRGTRPGKLGSCNHPFGWSCVKQSLSFLPILLH